MNSVMNGPRVEVIGTFSVVAPAVTLETLPSSLVHQNPDDLASPHVGWYGRLLDIHLSTTHIETASEATVDIFVLTELERCYANGKSGRRDVYALCEWTIELMHARMKEAGLRPTTFSEVAATMTALTKTQQALYQECVRRWEQDFYGYYGPKTGSFAQIFGSPSFCGTSLVWSVDADAYSAKAFPRADPLYRGGSKFRLIGEWRSHDNFNYHEQEQWRLTPTYFVGARI